MVVGPRAERAAASADVDDGGERRSRRVAPSAGRIPKIPVWIRKKSEISLHFLGLIGRGATVASGCISVGIVGSRACFAFVLRSLQGAFMPSLG